MPRVVSRPAISESKQEEPIITDPTKALTIHYCICGEFILVLEGPLESLSRRPIDNAYVLKNVGNRRHYKLNAAASQTGQIDDVMIKRTENEYEYQRILHCTRCDLPVGYETKPALPPTKGKQKKPVVGPTELPKDKGPATFIYPGSLSLHQTQAPKDAFGDTEL